MKFARKIFITTLFMVILALNLGETVMLSMSFEREVESEVTLVKNENLMMRTEIAMLVSNYNRSMYRNEREALYSVLKTLSKTWETEDKQIRISDVSGAVLFEQEQFSGLIDMNQVATTEDHIFYKVYQEEENYYLQVNSYLKLAEQEIIIENSRNITPLYRNREAQRSVLWRVILAISAVAGVMNWAFVSWISRPVKELTKATKLITTGNLKTRVNCSSKDELALLSEHFNLMAESLEQNMEELKEAARRQEDFVGSFAHEIKTPLTSIIGYADLMRSTKLDEETVFVAANYIYSEGKRLENLSLKLLELIVEKNSNIHPRECSIYDLVESALEITKFKMEDKQISVQFVCESVQVHVDMDLMKTVLINVLDNARKAVEPGGSIMVEAFQEEIFDINMKRRKIMIRITDNGKGIPKEELDKVKEAFYMVDKSRSRQEGGAGLGLTICTQIMKLHDGDLSFESELGKGTTVTLSWYDQDV